MTTTTEDDDPSIFNENYVKAEMASLISAKTAGENKIVDGEDLQIQTIAQMTTGDNARLFIEVRDKLVLQQSMVLKRELVTLASSLAIGLAGGVASALATAANKYLATKYGTILSLENLSKENDPYTLFDPIWYR